MQFIMAAQEMEETTLKLRVKLAITSNRMTRINNPIIRDKIKTLKRKADSMMQHEATAS
jgi:hypothetical protein